MPEILTLVLIVLRLTYMSVRIKSRGSATDREWASNGLNAIAICYLRVSHHDRARTILWSF